MTGQWRPLPASLDPEIAYLVSALRDLKDRSGLSLAAVATRTPYSKSSWERYLNGRILPPRHAVEALADVTGQPTRRLIALWEQAEARWSGRDRTDVATAEPTVAPVADAPPPGRNLPGRAATLSAAAVATCVVGTLLVVLTKPFGILKGSVSAPPGYSVGCHGAQCAGREPEGMACALDAVTSDELRVEDTYVELRISHRCEAAWTRVSHTKLGDQVLVSDQDGRTETATVTRGAATTQYISTRMIAVGRGSQVRACLQRTEAPRRCTTPVQTL